MPRAWAVWWAVRWPGRMICDSMTSVCNVQSTRGRGGLNGRWLFGTSVVVAMAGAEGRRSRGPVRRARRRWAAMGLPRRIVTAVLAAVIGLLVVFIVLGAILAACGVGEEETPESPSPSRTAPTTSSPGVPPSRPPVTETATGTALPVPPSQETTPETTESEPTGPTTAPPADVYYENCDEARAAGDAPLFAGDPGYGPHLDRDGDGVACEP
ncbi:excalibur calcium-binding domain-containing protein [Streptomyces sp. NPDC019531]|uniref:excalibur calcium-binding domain-containing protein n=1 Tax=Streptomyces sp. NPDC019531 TaxID=3365062 RepID=UPI00384F88B7